MTIIQTNKPLQPRKDDDFYETPPELCRAALRKFISSNFMGNILDPGCGNGNWGRAVSEYLPKDNYYLAGIDIRTEVLNYLLDGNSNNPYDDITIGNYLNYRNLKMRDNLQDVTFPQFDLIIGNPPYRFAEEFIRQSFEILKDDGRMVLLLRLAFLQGINRGRGLFKEFPLVEVAVSTRRVPFYGTRRTDDTPYAIYYWSKGYIGPTFLDWLDWSYDS